MTNRKSNDPNIKPINSLYNRSWSSYIDDSAFSLYPSKDQWREQFCYTLLLWAEKESSLDIVQFTSSIKMRRQTLYEWVAKYPDIKAAFEEAKLLLACRKRVGAMTKKFDKDAVYKDMHRYDPEWHEINQYHADMKKEDENKPTTFVINMNKPKVIEQEVIDIITKEHE